MVRLGDGVPMRGAAILFTVRSRYTGMLKRSGSLLMYHRKKGVLEVFLIHLGGPFCKYQDA